MQIQVKCGCDAPDCSEWALLELQGVLEIQPSAQQLPLHTLSIGSLCCTEKDRYSLTIGYHQLEGKKVPLKKPLLVLRKIRKDEATEVGEIPGTQYPPPMRQTVELSVVGVIRHKLLFKTRPKALITR